MSPDVEASFLLLTFASARFAGVVVVVVVVVAAAVLAKQSQSRHFLFGE